MRIGSAYLGGRSPHHGSRRTYGRSVFDALKERVRAAARDERGEMALAAPPQRKKKSREGGGDAVVVPLLPFTAASHEGSEPFFDKTVTPGAGVTRVDLEGVPSNGFIRGIWILVESSGGVAGTAGDLFPFNIIENLQLTEPNGAELYGALGGKGHDFLANLFGGYAFQQDPRLMEGFSSASATPLFGLWVPVEIHHNTALGAISNMNAAASYKLQLSVAASTAIWTVAPTTIPALRIRAWTEFWKLPPSTDRMGRPQAQVPPLHGTGQFWSRQGPVTVAAGQGKVQVTRMGNIIRTLIFVFRDNTGARSDTVMPENIELWWDDKPLFQTHRRRIKQKMGQQFITSSSGLPTGVAAFSFDTDVLGHGGDGTPELWIPTTQGTRLELRGTFGAAGTVDVLVNDIAPVEVDPAFKYAENSETGFEPAI